MVYCAQTKHNVIDVVNLKGIHYYKPKNVVVYRQSLLAYVHKLSLCNQAGLTLAIFDLCCLVELTSLPEMCPSTATY